MSIQRLSAMDIGQHDKYCVSPFAPGFHFVRFRYSVKFTSMKYFNGGCLKSELFLEIK